MGDITDERLGEIAEFYPLGLAICASMGDPSWADVRSIASELLAARKERDELRAAVKGLRFVIRSYLAWRNYYQDDCGAEESRAALSALRAAAEEPKP